VYHSCILSKHTTAVPTAIVGSVGLEFRFAVFVCFFLWFFLSRASLLVLWLAFYVFVGAYFLVCLSQIVSAVQLIAWKDSSVVSKMKLCVEWDTELANCQYC